MKQRQRDIEMYGVVLNENGSHGDIKCELTNKIIQQKVYFWHFKF